MSITADPAKSFVLITPVEMLRTTPFAALQLVAACGLVCYRVLQSVTVLYTCSYSVGAEGRRHATGKIMYKAVQACVGPTATMHNKRVVGQLQGVSLGPTHLYRLCMLHCSLKLLVLLVFLTPTSVIGCADVAQPV